MLAKSARAHYGLRMARGLAIAVVALLVLAAPARATEHVVTNCANVQSTIDAALAGDTVTLNVSCTGSWSLKSFATPFAGVGPEMTIQGGGAGITLTGDGSNRIFTGNDIRRLLIQNITFRGGEATDAGEDGGAIEITGHSGLQVFNSAFFDNRADDRGGAIHFANETPPGAENNVGVSVQGSVFGSSTVIGDRNRATTGGAVSVESVGANDQFSLGGSTFTRNFATGDGGAFHFEMVPTGATNVSLDGNQVIENTAGGSGGGGHVVVAHSILNISGSLYQGNTVEPTMGGPTGVPHLGGGLYVEAQQFVQPELSGNDFVGNEVGAFTDGHSFGGGIAFVGDALNADSEYGRYEGNSVGGDGTFESEGGGIYLGSANGSYYGFLDAIAGNSVGDDGRGGGLYAGATAGETTVEFGESTIAANTVGDGGSGTALAGDGPDNLIMRNTIAWNDPNFTGIVGFDSFDITYSDACQQGASPFPGDGNICADPKLVGGTDVHQTTQSPTIDKGNDAYVEDEGGGERNMEDYEGDPRPTDGDGDGHTVDMGADESPAFVAQPPIVPDPIPPPQCSDGADNDGDGAIDSADPGCLAGPTDNNEGDETQRDLILCGQRTISLVRADVRGSKVVLSGIVATSLAGQKVDLSVRYLGGKAKAQKLGSVTPGADGQFQARVKKPSRKLFNAARYRAQVGSAKSVELKLPQSLASSGLKQVAGGMLELRGQVDRTLLGKRNPVVIKRILCGRYTTVGQAKPNKKGVYVVRFPSPPSQGSALYRAETKVLARPGSKRYVKQFARAIGITF